MADTPTKSTLNKKKVAELRGELTELGLATNGIKADLVQEEKNCVDNTKVGDDEESKEEISTGRA